MAMFIFILYDNAKIIIYTHIYSLLDIYLYGECLWLMIIDKPLCTPT